MKKIREILQWVLLVMLVFIGQASMAFADINLTVRDGDTKIFEGIIPLPEEGMLEMSDNTGEVREVNMQSVLAILSMADQESDSFSISNLEYYPPFNPDSDPVGSLYLKCIIGSDTGEKCDNWQYVVNGEYVLVGMDKKILSDGESVYIYFGPQNKITLSSGSITTAEELTVNAQKYNYEQNEWLIRTEVTVGVTQPDPNNPWTPVEVTTLLVGENGQAVFSSIPEGSYNVGIKEDFYFPIEPLVVTAPPVVSSGGGSYVYVYPVAPEKPEKKKFDIDAAFDFLSRMQKDNGSFGSDLYTDWVATSFGAYENPNHKLKPTIKLVNNMGEFDSTSVSLTDLQRHAMALMSLGLNPYNTNNVNYIQKIVDSFDGTQFGEIDQNNDDIFALIVLQNAGYSSEEDIIKGTIANIIAKQNKNGSWNESIDMTGAAIQALALFSVDEQVKNALLAAKDFLKQNQKEDGGWGNVSSTAWAIGGVLSLNEKPEEWTRNDATPIDYLATNQDIDGGIKNKYLENSIWETAYALTALSGKTWNQIMQKFNKPEEKINEQKKDEIEKKLDEVLFLLETKTKAVERAKAKSITSRTTETVKMPESLKLTSQNTATLVNAFEDTQKEIKATKKEGWFKRLIKGIFGF